MTVISSAITGITDTNAVVPISNYGADGTVDLQISTRQDFQFCVCPIYNFARADNLSLAGLNQQTTYWLRARNRAASGAIEDWSNVEAFRTTDRQAQVTTPATVMIQPAMLILPEKVIDASAAGTLAGFPVDNLFRDSPVAWRSTGDAGVTRTFTLYLRTAGQPVDTLALLNTNLPETALISVSGGPTQAAAGGNAPDFTTAAVQARASAWLPSRSGFHALHPLGATRRSIWYRIAITMATTPANMIHVEHLVIGLNRVTKNIGGEKTETPSSLTTIERKRSGIPDRVLGLPMRKVDFEIDVMTEAQFEQAYGQLWRRDNEPVFAIPNSKAGAFLHDRMLYGDLSGGRVSTSTPLRFSRGFTINSLI